MVWMFAVGVVATNAWIFWIAHRQFDNFKSEQKAKLNSFEEKIFKNVEDKIREAVSDLSFRVEEIKKKIDKKK